MNVIPRTLKFTENSSIKWYKDGTLLILINGKLNFGLKDNRSKLSLHGKYWGLT